ncbi:hypothetical protein AYJ57_24920 (plasmid) [Salipiger sp. CCB-MM3]|uniref:LysR family transcriptional regulator n=1 Tax=Salipiger sp. CCB-MM3 TaxID=1792508 RepID=UPI00080ABFF7|nr:LysR family transcriptional regulator [Salipiger sp. CCB-MM3]ANT63718.1 hypothetical protein AYJ57_24920 [Salipiger sp. CCB-MM3]
MNMNLRQLETFRLFSRTQSVTETARLMRVSQPAVSQTLKELEGQLGFSLFVRSRGRTRLTQEARDLLPSVERIFVDMTVLRGKAEELRDLRGGSLSIATVTTFTAAGLPKAISAFRQERERVRMRLEVFSANEVVRQVRQEYADIGFAFQPFDEVGVASHPLLEMSMICLMPKDHRLAGRASVSAADLEGEVIVAHGNQSPPGVMLRESLRDEVNTLDIMQTNQSTAALHLVQAGLGVALTHPMVLPFDPERRLHAAIFEPKVKLTLAMLYSRARPVPRLVQRFERHLRQCLVDYADEVTARGLDCRFVA